MACLHDLLRRRVRPHPARRGIARDDPGDHERQDHDAHHDEQPEGHAVGDEARHPVGVRPYTNVTLGYAGLSTKPETDFSIVRWYCWT